MEAVFAICAAIGFSVLLFGGISAFVVLRNRADGARWGATAQQLGLTLGEARRRVPFLGGGVSIHQPMLGHRAGMPVEIGIRVVVSGSGRNRSTQYFTYASVTLPKDLDLGLRCAAQGWLTRAFSSVVGQGDVQIGDPELDPAYHVMAVDQPLVIALLRVPYVRESLLWLRSATFRPSIGDTGVKVEARGKQLDVGALSLALDSAVDLARRVAAAREQIGPSTGQRAMEQWQLVAQDRGLAVDADNTRMSGRYEGVHVEVDAVLRNQQRWTVFTVRFNRPLGVGLKMTRESSLHSIGKVFGMQDIETGDRAFDARFVIKGNPAGAVLQMLTPEVRGRLGELADQATKLEVHDDRLTAEVSWLVSDPAHLESGLATVARAGAALAKTGPTVAGPFR